MSHEQQVWQAYRSRLYHFVRKRVGDAATAEDIVHDVLTRAYEQRDSLRDYRKFQPWLYQIARNAIIDHFRRRRPTEELPPDLPDGEEETVGVEKELAQCLTPLIEELPGPYRQAVVLSELEGLTQREVALETGLSVSGAKSRVQRARKMLEALLLACCRFEFDGRGSLLAYEPRGRCDPC